MPASQSRQFASDFVQGLKASTIGSVRKTYQDAKEIASGSASISGTVGVLAVTIPAALSFPLYFFVKGLVAHTAEALRAVPDLDKVVAQPQDDPAAEPQSA